MSAAEPRYRHIEFCRKAETLWEKIKSGKWDWLGVHADGQFVLGSPPSGGTRASISLTVGRAGVPEGLHGVRTQVPLNPEARGEWFATEDDAKAAFRASVEAHSEGETPLVIRIERIEEGAIAEREFIVRRPTTYR